jgi:hypothetical protein
MLNPTKYYGKYTDGGSRNSFYTIEGSKYGFKSFPNKDLARFAHSVQDRLSKSNLAPFVYSQVGRIRIPEYISTKEGPVKTHDILSNWGYLTEIAKYYECANYGDEDYECDEHCYYEGNCKNYDKICNLFNAVSDLGVEYSDGHNGNLGWVIRNRKKTLVIIDLGRESIGDYDRGIYPNVDEYGEYDEYGYNNYDHCSCTACRRS